MTTKIMTPDDVKNNDGDNDNDYDQDFKDCWERTK
jgi:hypothetical protein